LKKKIKNNIEFCWFSCDYISKFYIEYYEKENNKKVLQKIKSCFRIVIST